MFDQHTNAINALHVVGSAAYTASRDCTARKFDIEYARERKLLPSPSFRVAVAWRSLLEACCGRGRLMLTGSTSGHRCGSRSGMPLQVFLGHSSTVRAICASDDGEYVVTGGKDATVRCFRASSGEMLWFKDVHQDYINHVVCRGVHPVGNNVDTCTACSRPLRSPFLPCRLFRI